MSKFLPAIHQAKALYEAAGIPEPFEKELSEYLRDGYVAVQPQTFAMARTMRTKTYSPEIFNDLEPADKDDGADVWFICMAVGKLKPLLDLLPFDLPMIAFCRHWKQELKLYSF